MNGGKNLLLCEAEMTNREREREEGSEFYLKVIFSCSVAFLDSHANGG